MIKGRVLLVICVLAILSLVAAVIGCESSAPAPSPAPAPTASANPSPALAPTSAPALSPTSAPSTTQKPAQQPGVIKWVVAGPWGVSNAQTGLCGLEYIERIKKVTNGRVMPEMVLGGALLKDSETLPGLQQGVCDMSFINPNFFLAKLPIAGALASLADLDIGNKLDTYGVARISRRLAKEVPEYMQDFTKNNVMPVMWGMTSTPYQLCSSVPVRKLEDAKGIKIRAVGQFHAVKWKAIDAVPMVIPPEEAYTALQTRLIVGVDTLPTFVYSAKLYENTKYYLETRPGNGPVNVGCTYLGAINMDSWKKLPPDLQDAILKMDNEFDAWASWALAKLDADIKRWLVEKHKFEIVQLPPAEVERWNKLCPDMYAMLAQDMNSKGLPGDKFIATFKKFAREYIDCEYLPSSYDWNSKDVWGYTMFPK